MKRAVPVLAAAALVIACALWWPQVRDESFVIFGNRDEAGGWYGFWSGFAGGVRLFEWPVIIALVWWHHTCHVDGCWRPGRFPLAGGAYKVCRPHLPPDHPGKGQLTARHIHLAHRVHQLRNGAGDSGA